MTLKGVARMLAGLGAVLVGAALKHRRIGVDTLGPMSGDWIAEHAADRPA